MGEHEKQGLSGLWIKTYDGVAAFASSILYSPFENSRAPANPFQYAKTFRL